MLNLKNIIILVILGFVILMSCTLITSKDSPESVLESAMTVCEEHVKLEARIESGEDKAVLKEEFGGVCLEQSPSRVSTSRL